jgi:hypothetical protein
MRLTVFQHALAAATVGCLGVRPRSLQSWGLLPPVARHLSKVPGQYAPSTVVYADCGDPDCNISDDDDQEVIPVDEPAPASAGIRIGHWLRPPNLMSGWGWACLS